MKYTNTKNRKNVRRQEHEIRQRNNKKNIERKEERMVYNRIVKEYNAKKE